MRINVISESTADVANVIAEEKIITDAQSAIDLMMTVKYKTGIKNIAISKNLIQINFWY